MCGAVKLTTNADPDKYEYFVMSMNLMHVEVFRHQMLDGATFTADNEYAVNFGEQQKRFFIKSAF